MLGTAEAFNDDAAATISCLYRCFASEHGQHAVHCGLLSERLFHQAKSFRADQASQSMPMELLWSALAPRSITDPVHWNATQRVEALASELEQVLWLEPINVELGYKIWQLTHSLRYRISRGHMNQIEDAMHQIRDAAQQLAKEEEGLEKLYPIFKDEFASVSLRLSAAAPERPLLQFLANRTAIPFSHRAPPFDRSDLVLCGQGALLEPLVSRTISSLSVLRGGTLRQLSLSYFELGTLSKTLARNPHLLNTDPASEAMPMLDKAMNLICQCIAERQGSSSVPANLSSMSAKFMTLQSLGVQTGHPAQRATKWLSFGFSCLRSYITRKPYDPQLMIKVRADLLRSQLEKHMSNLEAWKWVEHRLSGGEWNLKIAWGEHELDRLRQRIERESSGIERIRHRPSKSRLKELHRTLVDIRGTLPLSAQEDEEMAVRLVQSHDPAAAFKARRELIIVQLSALQEFGEYRDLITPPQIFLECVYYGLCLMEVQQRTATGGDSESGNYAPTLIPLLNATPQSLSLYAELKGNTGVASVDWETRLQVCSLLIPLQGTEKRKLQVYRTASASFHELYWDWKSQLRVDQERNAAKSRLYRYVGLEENDEDVEELSELFGELISEGRSKSYDAKSSGQQVAKLHAAVFTPEIGGSADDRLVDMIRQYQFDGDRAMLMSLSHEPETEALVSVLLLRLQDAKEELADVASPSISFYHGINIKEIRRLVGLLYAIQDRFMQLRVVWPEHSSILDTLSKCKEILGRSFRESLANLTTEVEQLHAIIYEWQSIADRENSVAALYDQLTELLISWRRLELRSWSALLKAEEEKCIVDAYDWWYIGYEAVVMSCEDSTVDQQQIVKLVATLQDFLSATPLGQFNQRLMMLTQYAAELGTGWGDSKLPMRVRDAVLNVIRCFTRFGRYVDEHLEGARKKLQKEIDEVILLATWKDTNIVALRESARRSHMKLLRIVRKYRKELSKAAQEIMPDPSRTLATMCNPPVQAISEDCNEPVELDVSVRIGSLASALDSGHDFSVNRFRLQEEAYRIVRNSVRASRGSCDTVDEEMLNFTSNVSRLQKQGPQVLTEENKSEIKHLRAQKRRLFAETLKMLKDMGIRAALDSTTIEKQQGAAELLSRSSLPSKSGDEVLAQAEEAFYQVVELAPQIWKCATQHSEEITAQEIIRSTGLLHGCIYEVVRQRSALATSYGTIVELKSMQESCRILETIEIDGPDELHEFEKSHDRNYVHEALAWSTLLMKTASKILNVQDELSQHELPSVQQEWQEWIRLLEIQERAVHLTLRVPSSLVGSKEVLAIRHGKKVLQHLGKELQLLGSQRPELHYLTCQVALWTDVRCYPVVDGSRKARASSRLDQVPDKALNVANTILAAVATMASALQEIPRDPEQKQWWVQTARCLITALLKPHLVELNDEWSAVLRAVQGMGSATRSQRLRLKSSFVILSTVLGQYVRVYQSVADHLAMIYRSTAHMTVTLSQNFLLISKRGFCTPGEKSKQESQGNEKLEAGTGLGEGDGAEDISKDIGDDEDLSELAQEPKAQREDGEDGDLENEKDAVEIADEMEGQIGEGEEEDDDGDERSNDGEDGDVDEELGSVGSAEAGALDESHMDGKQDESKREEEGRKDKGETSKDEQAAARQKQGKISEADDATASDQEDEDEDEAENGDDTRTGARDDAQADPHAQDQTQLDLPEDMDLDLDKEEGKSDYNDSDEMDAMSDVSGTENLPDAPETQEQSERRQELDRLLEEQLEELENEQQNNDAGEDEDGVSESAEGENYGDQAEETAEEALDENDSAMRGEQEDENEDLPMRNDDGNLLQVPGVADDADPGDTAPSDAIGQGEEQAQEQQNQDPQRQPGAPSQREKGQQGRAGETDQTIGDRGEDEAEYVPHSGKSEPKSRRPRQENSEKVSKQLGDGSEQFHRGNEDLLPANKDEDLPEDGGKGLDGGEYQHLSNEDESYDTQALGAAETEQVPPVNEAMAIDDGEETSEPMNIDNIVPSESEKLNQINEPMNLDIENEQQMRQQDSFTQVQPYINRPSQSQAEHSTNPHANGEGHSAHGNGLDVEESLVDDRTPPQQEASILELITPSQAASLWSHYISRTMPLSHLLTESLRLILTPTRATKFRGAFKTGRRLNMRRIIPYVASGYKKDKIWMRRSVAGKREYRILIGIDGSRSMGEALTSVPAPPTQTPGPFSTSTTDRSLRARTAGEMALYTLALLSQSLSTLEIPQLAILSFGDQPTVHKPFDQPLTPQLGQGIVRRVNFREERTDVRRLLETSLEMFRRDAAAAGMRGGAGGDAKVWGLMIILGDGICEEHELLRRLVRALRDECRVLVVFVVVDVPAPVVQSQPQSGTGATADRPPTAPSTGLQGPAHAGTAGKGADGGIMTMTQARFETEPGTGEARLVMERYLDRFPFEYYVIVRRVEELPGVLSEALRGWFREVVDV